MQRPLFLFAIAMILGISTVQWADTLWAVLPGFVFLCFVLLLGGKKASLPTFLMVCIMAFYLVGAFEALYIHHRDENRFSGFSGQQVTLRGYILSEPQAEEAKVTCKIRVTTIEAVGGTEKVQGDILFTTLKSEELQNFHYGNAIEIRGVLNIPKGKRNPGGFDYREHLLKSGMSATIFATGNSVQITKDRTAHVLKRTGLSIRNHIVQVINKNLPPEQAGLLNGMLIGYREGLDKDVQTAFSDAGLTHIMAVSGMNVAFIVAPMVFLFRRFRLRQTIGNVSIICILLLFVFVTGFSPSVVRAVVMAIVVLVGQLLRRETDVVTSLSFAAILLLLFQPGMLMDIGFQLSFAATLSLILFYKKIRAMMTFKYMPRFLSELLAVTLAAQVGVLPITAYYFNKISLISVFTNILVVPLTGVITILGFIMAAVGQISIPVTQLLGTINCSLLSFILLVTRISARIPWAVLRMVTPSILLILSYYIAIFYFLWFKEKYHFRLSGRLLLPILGVILCGVIFHWMGSRGLEVVFLDVGQGDAAFIRTSTGKTVLIDGGGYSSRLNPDSTMGEMTVIPFLLDYGVTKLDVVIATHGHDDHIQGLQPILNGFSVDHFILPKDTGEKALEKLKGISGERGIRVDECTQGQCIRLDKGTYFDVLNPDENRELEKGTSNNISLVLKLHYKKISILFTGDIEEEIEKKLMEQKLSLGADVLKVAHHGSITSTSRDFLIQVHPSAAIISVGKNTFGHPALKVLERLKESAVQVFRTDQCGGILLSSDGSSIRIKKTIQD